MALLAWFRELVKRVQDPYEAPVEPLFGVGTMRVAAPFAHTMDLERYCAPLVDACWKFQITTKPRIAAFLAQVAHESASFSRVEEMSTGKQYEARFDLGNTEPGDGVRFKGHGLIQLTGRWNHVAVADGLGVPFGQIVPYLLSPAGAAMSAAWYWNDRRLNPMADICSMEAFDLITKAINGGLNGKADRDRRYIGLCTHLGVEIRRADA